MNSRLPITIAAVALTVLSFAYPVDAQQERGRWRGGSDRSSPMRLIGYQAVQQDLALSEDQVERVNELRTQMRESYTIRYDRDALEKMSEEERNDFRTKMRAEREKVGKEYEAKLKGVVGESGMKRLGEIGIQAAGPRAVADDKIAKALELTEAQNQTIEEITTTSRQQMRELFQGGQRNREAYTKLTTETNEKYLAVLTDEQKKKFETLKGEPFDTTKLTRRRGGGQN